MTTVTSRELHNKLGQVLDKAKREPVTITQYNRPAVVMVPAEWYDLLQKVDDEVWLAFAKEAEKSGLLGKEESVAFLQAMIHGRRGPSERVSARGFLADLEGFGTEEFRKSKEEEIDLEEEKFERRSQKTKGQAA